jgi:hypothetical protein
MGDTVGDSGRDTVGEACATMPTLLGGAVLGAARHRGGGGDGVRGARRGEGNGEGDTDTGTGTWVPTDMTFLKICARFEHSANGCSRVRNSRMHMPNE